MFAHRIVVTHQLVTAQHQLAEVDDTFALALVFIGLVDLHQLGGVHVLNFDITWALAVFFFTSNEPGDLLGHKALFVQVHALDDALDGTELIGAVQNLETLRQAGELPVRAQKAIAQTVECANPHAAHGHRQHGGQAREHFFG